KQVALLSAIEDAERQPDYKARLLFRKLAYGSHPYGRPGMGRHETVAALTPADCLAFYRQAFVPSNTVVAIVGDFDSKQVIEEVTRLTADWKPGTVSRPKTPVVEKPKECVEKIVTMPTAS